MKLQRICLIVLLSTIVVPSLYAIDSSQYKESYRDYKTLAVIQNRVDTTKETFDEEELIYQLWLLSKYESVFSDNPQAFYILNQSKQLLIEALVDIDTQKQQIIADILPQGDIDDPILQLEKDWVPFIPEKEQEQSQISSVARNKVTTPETVSSISIHTPSFSQDEPKVEEQPKPGIDAILSSVEPIDIDFAQEVVSPQPETTPNADIAYSPQELYKQYRDTIQGEISPLCTVYYDQIDQIAKRNDFPTSLLIAIRYREHSCIFSNPDNGRWNFQITSHYYEPGEIVWDDFATQVQNFIDFSHAKRKYYDAIQKFGPEPVALSYDTMDINSIRKHAILYNGVYPDVTLERSWYSNENFTQFRWWRDGIVATVLKVIQRNLNR